ncbi:MAG: hypothetical protein QG670_1806 [Thermoproteota archaeon]|nr:hypothetical protein [Thermoproteota archaeon]
MIKDMYSLMKEREEKEKKDALELLRTQLKVEGELIRLYDETESNIQSSAVKHILNMLAVDSRKHVDICMTAIEVLEGNDVLKPEKVEILRGMQHHVELEKESIDAANKMLKNGWIREIGGLSELIKKLRDDEIEHHRIAKKLAESAFFRIDSMGMASLHDVDWLEEKYVQRKRANEYVEKMKGT